MMRSPAMEAMMRKLRIGVDAVREMEGGCSSMFAAYAQYRKKLEIR